ncbi:MAG: flagellin [Pseudomonadota bacterium]|nr:flagellin [Pseudomonadota bacterium]|tara:strand:+ start:16 stop:906 length:891 start_codon:yes stop_codon:yes gene_type:complete
MVAFNSIYTNPAAYTALQSLNKINRNLDISQNRVASGLRVASALDNASSFSIAQGIRGEIAAIDSLQSNIAKVKGIVDYTLAAAEGISDLTGQIRAKFQEMASTSSTANQRTAIGIEIQELVSQARALAKQAANKDEHAGSLVDLFSVAGGGANLTVATNILFGAASAGLAASTIVITKAETAALFSHLNSFANQNGTAATTDRANSILNNQFATYETAVATALGKLAGKSRQLEGQQDFLTTLKATRQEIIGGYVDTDLATESARLTALQVQQQLAVQAIGIANQRPQSLLGLFR